MTPFRLGDTASLLHALERYSGARRRVLSGATGRRAGAREVPPRPTPTIGLSVVPLDLPALGSSTWTKWGSFDAITDDVGRLGASILTFPGRLDLTWIRLAIPPGTNLPPQPAIADVPTFPADPEAVMATVVSAANVDRLVGELRALHDAGLRVVLTAMSTWREPRAPNEEKHLVGFVSGIAFPWGADHVRVRPTAGLLEDDGAELAADLAYAQVIDPESSYDRTWLAWLSTAIALLLVEVAAALSEEGIDLAGVVDGVAFFMTPSERCVYPHPLYKVEDPGEPIFDGTTAWQAGNSTRSRIAWSTLWWSCASAFDIAQRSRGLALPVRLPVIGSHFEWERDGIPRRESWAYRERFWTGFLRRLVGLSTSTWDGAVSQASLCTAVGYQWFHRAAVTEPAPEGDFRLGPRHIAHLLADVVDIRTWLDAEGFGSTRIDLVQTGISVDDPDEFVPSWADGDAERFQAFEVWRRLGGGLAAGVSSASLQAWMSWPAGGDAHVEYTSMGLRRDGGPQTTPTSAAVQRPAWYAYQRFVSLLGRVVSGELLYPAVLPADVTWVASTPEQSVVVFHYTVEEGEPFDTEIVHLCLMLVDPTAGEVFDFEVQVDFAAGAVLADPTGRAAWALDPDRQVVAVPLTPVAYRASLAGTGLPRSVAVYGDQELLLVDGSRPVDLWVSASEPVLLRASEALDVTLRRTTVGGAMPRPTRTLGMVG